ncbi:MAG: hypothetical protein IJ325_12020 [Clostridia bacterium]|nr:hypothetical protein [Clostridia bacterium]
MIEKIKNSKWLLPLWWLAVLYVWFGSLHPFLFDSHDLNPDTGPSPWLTAAYIMLLTAGILLFRHNPLFRGIFTACRTLQTLSLLLLILLNNIPAMADSLWGVSVISALTVIPYIGMYRLQLLWLHILLFLFSLCLTVLALLKKKTK